MSRETGKKNDGDREGVNRRKKILEGFNPKEEPVKVLRGPTNSRGPLATIPQRNPRQSTIKKNGPTHFRPRVPTRK